MVAVGLYNGLYYSGLMTYLGRIEGGIFLVDVNFFFRFFGNIKKRGTFASLKNGV